MENCFKNINIELSIDNKIFKEYKNFSYQHVDISAALQRGRDPKDVVVSSTFKRVSLPKNYFEGEAIDKLIKDFNLSLKIFLIEPGYVYNWHRDAYRHLAFNCMLGGNDDYLVLFAHEYPNGLSSSITFARYSYFPAARLVYSPRRFYTINTQIPHISINFGKEARYLLTLAEYEDNPLKTEKTNITNYNYFESAKKKLQDLGYFNL